MACFANMNAQDLSDAIDVLIAARYSFDLCAQAADHSAGASSHFCFWADQHRDQMEAEIGAVVAEYLSRHLDGADVQQRVYALSRAYSFIVGPSYAPPNIEGVGAGL